VSEAGAGAAPQWRRSRRSGSTGGQCVEVAATGDGLVRIRDSKDPGGPQIVISAAWWRQSLPYLTGVPDAAGDCLVAACEGGWMLLRDARQPEGAILRFTTGEWEVFLAGARDDEFSLTAEDRLRPAGQPARRLRELFAAGRRLLSDTTQHGRLAGGTVHVG